MLTELPARCSACWRVLVDVLMLVICGFRGLVYGTNLCHGDHGPGHGRTALAAVGYTYSPLPMGGLITLLFVLEHIFWARSTTRGGHALTTN
jgi:TRAP-type C4-dicarboxylate transport system permease small subunit